MTILGGMADLKDIGAALTLFPGSTAVRTSAAETAITADGFDHVPPGGGDANPISHESGVILVVVEGNLDAAATLSLALAIQDAAPTTPGGPTAGAYAAADAKHQPVAAAVIQGGAGGAFKRVLRYDLRFSSLRRFIRAVVTPDFSAAGGASATNTATITILYVAGAHNVVTSVPDWTPVYDQV